MHEREIYPNAPISLVIAEIRHPVMGEISTAELSGFKSALDSLFPVVRWEENMDFEFPSGRRTVERFPRFVSRDLHRSVTVQSEAVVVESTVYEGWEDFRNLVETVIRAHHRVKPLEGLDRIGLRYIDEIRVPGEQDPIDWADWVDADLVGPRQIEKVLDAPIVQTQGTAITQVTPNISYTVRYGAAEGQAVVSKDNLVRPEEPSGKYFLLDLDGAWLPSRPSVPEFQIDKTCNTLDKLHQPIRSLFESLITDKLRDEVLR